MKMSDSGEANDPQSNGREVRGGIDERAGPRLRGPGSRTRKRSPDKGVKKAACTPSSSSLFDHDQPVGGSEKLTRGEDASSCHQQKSQHQQRSPSSATILSVTHLPLNQRPEEGMTEMTFISPADDIRYPPDQIRR